MPSDVSSSTPFRTNIHLRHVTVGHRNIRSANFTHHKVVSEYLKHYGPLVYHSLDACHTREQISPSPTRPPARQKISSTEPKVSPSQQPCTPYQVPTNRGPLSGPTQIHAGHTAGTQRLGLPPFEQATEYQLDRSNTCTDPVTYPYLSILFRQPCEDSCFLSEEIPANPVEFVLQAASR